MILIPPHIRKDESGILRRVVRLNPSSYIFTDKPRPSCPFFTEEVIFDGLDFSYGNFLKKASNFIEVNKDDKVTFCIMDYGEKMALVNGEAKYQRTPGDEYLEKMIEHLCLIHGQKMELNLTDLKQVPCQVLLPIEDMAGHDGYFPSSQNHIILLGTYPNPKVIPGFYWLYLGSPDTWTPQRMTLTIPVFKDTTWAISGKLDGVWHHNLIKECVENKMIGARLEFQPDRIDTYILMASLGVRVCLECYREGPDHRLRFFLEEIGIRFRP